MKHTFKTLLGLVLVVFVLAGCSNPAGPETPEVNEPPVVETPEVIEPPVVETPEDTSNLTKVEFRWEEQDENFENYVARYLLGLYFDDNLNSYAYGFPEGYDKSSWAELRNDPERFKKFSEDAFEKVFGTKYYKEGTIIDLKKWTSKAKRLKNDGTVSPIVTWSSFSTEYFNREEGYDIKDSFDEIVVGNEDIVIYMCFDDSYVSG